MVDLKSKKRTIRAVTFDLWETLLFEESGSDLKRRAIRCSRLTEALIRSGLKVSVEEVEVSLRETISTLLKIWEKNKDVAHSDMIRIFLKNASKGKLKLKKDRLNDFTEAYLSALFEVPPYVNPDAREALEWLTNQKKRIGMICNTGLTPGTVLRRFLSEVGIARYFSVMIFSNEVGIRKPDRRIFNFAATALRARPQEIVHIGDNLKSDVWGAKNAGFKAIHLASGAGRDKMAESDPESLVSLSRNLGSLTIAQIKPDKTISSLPKIKDVIEELEAKG